MPGVSGGNTSSRTPGISHRDFVLRLRQRARGLVLVALRIDGGEGRPKQRHECIEVRGAEAAMLKPVDRAGLPWARVGRAGPDRPRAASLRSASAYACSLTQST